MDKTLLLQQLNDQFAKKCQSKLLATCQRIVPGTGSANAEIVFIGEAPGKKEDETGVPFVGAAGKFLDQMLATIKLSRQNIYITNIVKCRPPENRDPLPEEIAEFWPWLAEQIKLIQPKIVVTLGRHSLSSLIPNQKMSEVHGTVIHQDVPSIGKIHIYALYHPAAALYNGSMRQTLINDFQKIPTIIKTIINQEKIK
ncbi:MAG: uracil-DNA glycosylase [bacterium]